MTDTRENTPSVAERTRPVQTGTAVVGVHFLKDTAAFVLGPEEGIRLLDATLRVAGSITTETGRVASRRFYEHVVS